MFVICILCVFSKIINAQSDSLKIEELYQIGIQNLRVDPVNSYKDLEKALSIINDSILSENIDNRHFLLRKANILDRLAYNYRRKADYTNSLELLQQSLTIKEKINETQSLSLTYCYFGSLYSRKKDSVKALDFFNKAMDAAKRHSTDNIPYVLNLYSNYYMIHKDYEKGKIYAERAYRFSDSINNFKEKTYALILLSRYNQRKSKYESSIQYSLRALKIASKVNDNIFIELSNKELGYSYRKLGQPKKALDYYLKALELTEKLGFDNKLSNRYLSVSNAYSDLNQHKDAFLYYRLYKRQQIKNLNIKNIRDFAELDAEFKYKKEKLKDSLLFVQDKKLSEVKIETLSAKNKLNRQWMLFGTIGFIVLLSALYFRYKQRLKYKVLENELLNSEMEYKKKDLANFAINISENQKWAEVLIKKLDNMKGSKGRERAKYLNDLETEIKNKIWVDEETKNIHDKIDVLSSAFYEKLNSQFENLSKTDIKLCSLIKMGIDNKQIAILQNISPASVRMSRYRLRKKLNLSQDQDLNEFLSLF